jgi:hypothetical protein
MVERAATLPDARRAAPLRRQAAAAPDASRRPRVDEATGSLLLCLLIFSLAFPISFYLGETRLSVYRVLLLAAIVPLALRWVSGAAGRVTAVDLLVLAHCLWMGLAILVVHGPERLAFVSITTIELFGGYLIGRTLVTNRHVYKAFFRYFVAFLIFLFPFAVFELLTERVLINELFAPFFETFGNVYHDPRAGFWRVQTTFEHPILFGLFCSIGMANVFYIYRNEIAKQLPLTGFRRLHDLLLALVGGAALGDLPELPHRLGQGDQGALVAARRHLGRALRHDRHAVEPHADHHPDLGGDLRSLDGLDPDRPVQPRLGRGHAQPDLRHRLRQLAAARLACRVDRQLLAGDLGALGPADARADLRGARAAHPRHRARPRALDAELKDYRTGYLVALVGLMLTLCTVHIWGGTSVFVMAYIGAGAFFYTQAAARTAEAVGRRRCGGRCTAARRAGAGGARPPCRTLTGPRAPGGVGRCRPWGVHAPAIAGRLFRGQPRARADPRPQTPRERS